MDYPFPLEKVIILKRYKRFFADVQRSDGSILTVHVPNTGPMIGAFEPGWSGYIMPKAKVNKLTHGLELTQSPQGELAGVNTQIPNRLIKEALINKQIDQIKDYDEIIPEFTIGKSKLDFLLKGKKISDCFIEVKNCSGKAQDTAFFPDTRSDRAVKHLEELIDLKQKGHRTILIFLVQRNDVKNFRPGDEYHPEYGQLLRQALKLGIEIYPFKCQISLTGIELGPLLPLKL